MRPALSAPALSALAFVAALPVSGLAQCCGTPTVAYSPVVAAPPVAPVVQTTTVSNGWYPGKYLTDFTRSVFGLNQTTTYTAGYAPTPYTAGYAPTAYTAGYAPTYQTAYRPTYPATYGPVGYAQTVSRPVVLSPVTAAAPCDACSACGGVEQAVYASPSSGCSSCNAGASYQAPLQDYNNSYPEPRPALGPQDNPAPERSIRQRPEVDEFDQPLEDTFDDSLNDDFSTDPAAANDYWRAPPLFTAPSNRVTRRAHPAPTQTAVYRRPADTRRTAFRPATDEASAASGRVNRLSADGWGSSAD